MPVPTEDEVLLMRARAFPGVSEAGVKARMALWGPIPRHVLVSITDGQQAHALQSAQGVSVGTLVSVATSFDGGRLRDVGPDAPHRILHERATGQDAEPGTPAADVNDRAYYRRGRVVISSPSFLRYVAERLQREKAWNACFLIDASVGIGALGVLRGLEFEEVVLSLLQDGQKYKCRDLQTGAESLVTFPPSKRLAWGSVSQLTGMERTGTANLLVPKSRTKAGLDAFVWDSSVNHHWPIDCTVAPSHGLHASGLAAAVSALGWTPERGWPGKKRSKQDSKCIRYFWMVPEERYKEGWTARQGPKDGSVGTDLARAAFQSTEQVVVSVPSAVVISRVASLCQSQGVLLPDELLKAIPGI